MYAVVLLPKARKQLQKLQKKDQPRIAAAIDAIARDPFAGKKLHADLHGFWRWRVWPYRIVYMIEKKIITVTVVAIGDRKDIYEKVR